MLDKIDRKLLSLLQSDCTLSLQALADAVNLTTTRAGSALRSWKMTAFFWGASRC
jgi:Lrp/AsnC family transcriptional regulator